MLITNQHIGFGSARAELALSFIGVATSGDNAATFDFGNFSAPRDGLMIVLFVSNGGTARTVSTVSIGGVNGGIHLSNPSQTTKYAVASRIVSAGNNNVTVTLSGTGGSAATNAASVWLLTGYVSATPSDTDASAQATDTSRVVTFTIPARGVAVYGMTHSSLNAVTWSSATERYDSSVSFADKATAAEIIDHAETVSWSGSTSCLAFGASWA